MSQIEIMLMNLGRRFFEEDGTPRVDTDSEMTRDEFVNKFAKFVREQEDLEPEIVKMVDERFWDLF
tara:strand:- start:9970 stop:10167 length:198 start_codon:yes stop_codon:yes gene_type:complete